MDPLLVIANPFPGASGVLRLLEPVDADRKALAARLLRGAYDRPFVAEAGDERTLCFCWTYVQSRMLVRDPIALQMSYTRAMMGFLLLHPSPRAVLMLGLGGGSLAKYCHRRLPEARVTVVESHRDVLALRDAFGVPPDDARLRVVEDDAAAFVAASRARWDVVLMDAFDRHGSPPGLGERPFYEHVRAALHPTGVLVANAAGPRCARARHVATIAAVFGDNLLVVPVEEDDDDVVFAFRDPTFEPRWRWIASQAEPLGRRFGLDFPSLARRLKRGRTPLPGLR